MALKYSLTAGGNSNYHFFVSQIGFQGSFANGVGRKIPAKKPKQSSPSRFVRWLLYRSGYFAKRNIGTWNFFCGKEKWKNI
jgi:hypothetical protein